MTTPSDLAQRRLERARATLQEADGLIERRQYQGAISRLYYAVFYAARSLLATRHFESSKHRRAISLFQHHFVKTGLVPADLARVLQQSFEQRQIADYDDYAEPREDEVHDLRNTAERFVTFCASWLEAHLRESE